MNILGHCYVTTQAVSGNRKLLILGSILPESIPFIEGNPFAFNEIHEGGKALLQFLEKNGPEMRDLALGVLAHSAEYGVDKLNKEIEAVAGSRRDELLKKIALASGFKESKFAEYRLHNFLWWGLDCIVLQNKPEFVQEVSQAIGEAEIEEISTVLADCFGKDHSKSLKMVQTLFQSVYLPKDLASVQGLASIWSRQARGLPEHDQVDVPAATETFNECAEILKPEWETILERAISMVKTNLAPFSKLD